MSAKMGLATVGRIRATSLLRSVSGSSGARFFASPVSRTAAWILAKVRGRTRCGWFSARDTVMADTPAARATSDRVALVTWGWSVKGGRGSMVTFGTKPGFYRETAQATQLLALSGRDTAAVAHHQCPRRQQGRAGEEG